MLEGLPLVEVFKREHESRIEKFGLPNWLTCECLSCKLSLGVTSLQSFEVHFEPMFLGDIAFNYLCPECHALFSRHLKCDIKNLSELYEVLSKKECPATIVNSNDSLNFFENNVLKKICKEVGVNG